MLYFCAKNKLMQMNVGIKSSALDSQAQHIRGTGKIYTTNKSVKALQLLSLSLLSINLTLATNHSLLANKLLTIIYT